MNWMNYLDGNRSAGEEDMAGKGVRLGNLSGPIGCKPHSMPTLHDALGTYRSTSDTLLKAALV